MYEQELHNLAIIAVDQYAAKSVMPMIVEYDTTAKVCGTAILITHKDNYFIVTANHVAEYLHELTIGIPASPLKREVWSSLESEVWSIGNAKRHACQYDLAIIHLHSQDLIDRVCSAWKPLNYEDVRQPYLYKEAFYFIYGFPSSTSDHREEIVHSIPVSLVTSHFEGKKEGFKREHPFTASIDHLLTYSTKAIDPKTGNYIGDIPPTNGMSGSPVWQISREDLHKKNDIWSPDSKAKIVGFYTSDSAKYGWLRVRRWVVVDELLKELDLL